MQEAELLYWNLFGFIPGPGESEGDFLRRLEKTKGRFEGGGWIPEAHWEWVNLHLKEIFDFEPRFLPAYYSNKKLAPWQGAAAWIEGREVAAVQLREGLRKGRYLGLYRREEILAHEAVHAARSGFDESCYEEFFAYLTSEKKWRRVLGPIVKRPWEVWPFLVFSLLGQFWASALWGVLGFIRLIWRHRVLAKAGKGIAEQVHSEKKARAILFRLTDREIERFAKGEKIAQYSEKQDCLRWKVIKLAYLQGEDHGPKSGGGRK